jgi:hypothetical protein
MFPIVPLYLVWRPVLLNAHLVANVPETSNIMRHMKTTTQDGDAVLDEHRANQNREVTASAPAAKPDPSLFE